MPPRKSNKHNPPITTTQPPPPPQFNPAVFQVALTAVVTAAFTQINISGTSRGGTRINSDQGDSHGHPRECSYKDFTNCKPKAFHGNGGIIALSQWFDKIESIFDICSYLEGRKVKFVVCTFSDRPSHGGMAMSSNLHS